jgi:hypothetical protein
MESSWAASLRPKRSMVSAMEQGTGGRLFIFDVMEANTHRGGTTPIIGGQVYMPPVCLQVKADR